MAPNPRVIIVEDKVEDIEEVLDCLGEAEYCNSGDILGQPGTYDEALALLDEKAGDTDLVLLDLNLPRNDRDSRPEKGHGRRLLEYIHNLNKRPYVCIKVIVVSAETLDDTWDKEPLMTAYVDTLVGFVQKAELARMLKSNLMRLRRDPLRDRIRRLGVDVLRQYDVLIDPANPIRERVKEARRLAIQLVRCECDYFVKQPGAHDSYADDLNGLIKQLEGRFAPNPKGRHYIDASAIQASSGWGAFLWRGTLLQHLYTLNSYRNDYEHVDAKPFRGDGRTRNEWEIPPDVLRSLEQGETLGKVIELIVRELLEWYLPWHEQVYLPWTKSLGSHGERA